MSKKIKEFLKGKMSTNRFWCLKCEHSHGNSTKEGKAHKEDAQACLSGCHHPLQYMSAVERDGTVEGSCTLCDAEIEPRRGLWRQQGDSQKPPCPHKWIIHEGTYCENCQMQGDELKESVHRQNVISTLSGE